MCAYVCEREGGREEEQQEIELEGHRAQVLEALNQLAWMLSLGSLSRAVSVIRKDPTRLLQQSGERLWQEWPSEGSAAEMDRMWQ